MPGFVGQHERQVDQKGRLAMPPAYRARFETGCYLLKGENGCIKVMTPEEFEQMAEEVIVKRKQDQLDSDYVRTLFASAELVTLDAQGRINLDERLRRDAAIGAGSAVTVVGQWTHVEIWEPSRFQEIERSGTEKIASAS